LRLRLCINGIRHGEGRGAAAQSVKYKTLRPSVKNQTISHVERSGEEEIDCCKTKKPKEEMAYHSSLQKKSRAETSGISRSRRTPQGKKGRTEEYFGKEGACPDLKKEDAVRAQKQSADTEEKARWGRTG